MKAFGRCKVLVPVSVVLIATACSGSGASSGSSVPSSAPATVTSAAGGGNVAVTLKQWSITPTVSTVSGGSVTFTVTNEGTVKHEFVVLQTDTLAADFPITSFEGEKYRFNEDTAGTNVGETGDMAPAATKTIAIDLQPGHYAFVCNLPGHYGAGMHLDFTVS